jgi:hypothetical protein
MLCVMPLLLIPPRSLGGLLLCCCHAVGQNLSGHGVCQNLPIVSMYAVILSQGWGCYVAVLFFKWCWNVIND